MKMSEEQETNGAVKQLADMQQLLNTQLEIMKLQATNSAIVADTAEAASTVRRLSTPAARYDMMSHEFRSYTRLQKTDAIQRRTNGTPDEDNHGLRV